MVETSKYRTQIVEIDISAEDGQLTADIKVARVGGGMFLPAVPLVDDLPKDVREALITWLAPGS